jgi:hypothetical protein
VSSSTMLPKGLAGNSMVAGIGWAASICAAAAGALAHSKDTSQDGVYCLNCPIMLLQHWPVLCSGRIVAMELVAPGAIQKWRTLLGPTDSDQARKEAPNSIRAHFGTNKTYNACHGWVGLQGGGLS